MRRFYAKPCHNIRWVIFLFAFVAVCFIRNGLRLDETISVRFYGVFIRDIVLPRALQCGKPISIIANCFRDIFHAFYGLPLSEPLLFRPASSYVPSKARQGRCAYNRTTHKNHQGSLCLFSAAPQITPLKIQGKAYDIQFCQWMPRTCSASDAHTDHTALRPRKTQGHRPKESVCYNQYAEQHPQWKCQAPLQFLPAPCLYRNITAVLFAAPPYPRDHGTRASGLMRKDAGRPRALCHDA